MSALPSVFRRARPGIAMALPQVPPELPEITADSGAACADDKPAPASRVARLTAASNVAYRLRIECPHKLTRPSGSSRHDVMLIIPDKSDAVQLVAERFARSLGSERRTLSLTDPIVLTKQMCGYLRRSGRKIRNDGIARGEHTGTCTASEADG